MRETLVLTSEDESVMDGGHPFFDAMNAAARKKLNAPEGWRWYSAQVLTPTEDTLLKGGVPKQGKRGPSWKGVTTLTCVVTEAEIAAAKADYERETGKCAACAGSGKTLKSADYLGNRTYRVCSRCRGSCVPTPTVRPRAATGEE